MDLIKPFKVSVDAREINDLKSRLKRARWAESETTRDWSQGVPLDYFKSFCAYWRDDYDHHRVADRLNQFPQFTTQLDGLDIHFIHARSQEPGASALLITHGWPGSVIEFLNVIDPLINPTAYGANAEDAYHVVCPSIPGFGFSQKPDQPGWNVEKIARAWDELMSRLGYAQYYAQGGDWGAAITTEIGVQKLGHCAGIHLNMVYAWPTESARSNPTEADKLAYEGAHYYRDWGSGYAKIQSTRPQTVGYGLVDSPIGQAAWILEKFWDWTDCDGHPENAISRDEILDNIMLYWLNGAGASAARIYWESFVRNIKGPENQVHLPTGVTMFPKEIVPTPRPWAEQRYKNIVYWNEVAQGGHFAAFEQPQLFIEELRRCFRAMRT